MPMQAKLTPEDDQYIRDHPEMSLRELGDVLGVSFMTVKARKQQLGLDTSRAQDVTKAAISKLGTEFGETELECLHHLKSLLEEMMAEAAPTVFAKLSKEYRATMERIAVLEAPDPDEEEEEPNSIDQAIADALARL